jgi:hypothetical protein
MALQQQGQQQGSITFAQHAAARHALSAVAAGAKVLLLCCRLHACLLLVNGGSLLAELGSQSAGSHHQCSAQPMQ